MKWSTNSSSSLFARLLSKFNPNSSKKTHTHHNSNYSLDIPSPNSSFYRDEGRFYSLDEHDPYWRISFTDDRIQPRRSTGGINQDSDVFSPFPSEPRERNFSEMVSDIKRMRENRGRKQRGKQRSGEDNNGVGERNEYLPPIKVKREGRVRVPRTRASKAYSPRNECKIRALEEIRKARSKAKKRAPNEWVLEGNTVFDSVVVVKSSFDPRRDFKDSMVAVIREKGLGNPDELEDLLACYLTMNCSQYHDLIISVFTQVWDELKGDSYVNNVPYFYS
ncbi:transcription repressor OFP3-like [Salvia hispanica]|uniref:transcription repressor OFP3-like n=1 Tax=Salvia hispanica TaxID=49212 RepID=UPI0020097392|nr:transcription repressor OFP3-like [Salvia hispanica]